MVSIEWWRGKLLLKQFPSSLYNIIAQQMKD